jgi:hypothetical protein
MKRILTNGLHWPLEHINEELLIADVNKAIKFGNHPPMQTCQEGCKKWIQHHPPLQKAKLNPDLLFAPINIQHQNTIDEMKIIDKEGLTPQPKLQVRIWDVS